MAAQDLSLTDLALEAVVQALVFKAKAAVLINNLVKGISNSSLVIRVI